MVNWYTDHTEIEQDFRFIVCEMAFNGLTYSVTLPFNVTSIG